MLQLLMILAGVGIFEVALPQQVRQYGIGFFPWGEAERVKVFNREYGLVRLPRTLFAASVCLPSAVAMFFNVSANSVSFATLIFAAFWFVAAVYDLLRARKISMASDLSQSAIAG